MATDDRYRVERMRMKQICILSDTHGLLREEVKAEIARSDLIIHAGDIGTGDTIKDLKRLGRLYAVRGNIDPFEAENLPQSLLIEIEGLHIYIVHNKKDIPKNLTDIDVVIYGHSHRYAAEISDGILYLNPGSCGRRRFNLELSFCRMYIEHGEYRYEKLDIGKAPSP